MGESKRKPEAQRKKKNRKEVFEINYTDSYDSSEDTDSTYESDDEDNSVTNETGQWVRERWDQNVRT